MRYRSFVKDVKYRSRPHDISAFRFEGEKTKAPEWFYLASEVNKVRVVLNDRERAIYIENQPGDVVKAYLGQWICMDDKGIIFPLPPSEFVRRYHGEAIS